MMMIDFRCRRQIWKQSEEFSQEKKSQKYLKTWHLNESSRLLFCFYLITEAEGVYLPVIACYLDIEYQ